MVGRFSRLSSVTSPRDRVCGRVCARARRDPSPTCEMQCLARCRWGHQRARRRAAVRSCHQRLAGRMSRFTEWRLMTVRPRWRGRHLLSTSTWADPPGADVAAVEEGRSGGWLAGLGGGGGRRRGETCDSSSHGGRLCWGADGTLVARGGPGVSWLIQPPPAGAPPHATTPQEDRVARPPLFPRPPYPTPPHNIPPSLRHWPERGGGVPRGQGVSGWLWPARLPSRRAPAHPLGGAPPPSRRGWRGQLSHLPGLCAAQAVFCSHPMQLCALQHSCERCWWPWSRRRRRLRRRRRCPPVAEVAPCAPPPLPFPGGRIPISPFRCCLRRFSEGGSHRGSA